MRSSSRPRFSDGLLRLGGLAILGLMALLVSPVISRAQQAPNNVDDQFAKARNPNNPDDGLQYAVRINSPRETFSSFQRVSTNLQTVFADCQNRKDRKRAEHIYFVVDQ